MASVVVARSARRELLGLDRPLIDAVEDALGVLERDPLAGHALRGRPKGLRSLRVGAYRVIYQVTEGGRTVRVAAIRHRATAYRSDPRWKRPPAAWTERIGVAAFTADCRGTSPPAG